MEINSGKIITLFKCEKCDLWIKRKDSYYRHLQSEKHKMNKDEYKEKLQQQGRNAILNGEENENFILEVLKTFDFEDVIFQGFTGNKFDVFIKFRDEIFYRGLQIKTLIYYPDKDQYVIKSNRSGYENDTLIIAVNNDKTRYALIFYNEMKGKKNFIISQTHNANKITDNFDMFKLKLIEYARISTTINNFNDSLCESQRQEAESVNRFRLICESLNIPFKQNSTNTNEIDAIVNGHNVQFKSSRNKNGYMYGFTLRRTSDKARPYSVCDNVDFFIFEIVDEGYQNLFYIISKKILINSGHVSNNNIGKLGIQIAPYNYNKYHWTLQFLNRFDQLVSKTIVHAIHNRLHKTCINIGYICELDKNKIKSINSKKIYHIKHSEYDKTSCKFDLRIQKNNQRRLIRVDDNYEFLIFDFGESYPNQFCIIPITVLVQTGYISTNDNKGKSGISIPYIGTDAWTNYYMNNFELLRYY